MLINVSSATIPSAAGTVFGNAAFCANETDINYSIAPVSGATTYIWAINGDGSITSGQGTNIITADYGITGTTTSYTVTPSNVCGDGLPKIKTVAIVPTPLAAGAITGALKFCADQTAKPYSIAAVTGASTYTWDVLSGSASVGSGQGTRIVGLDFGSAIPNAVNMQVTPYNTCGVAGVASSLAINEDNPVPTFTITPTFKQDTTVASVYRFTNHSPQGGVFSGFGVTPLDSTFRAANVPGPGDYPIVYTYTNSSGCTDTTVQDYIITAPPVVPTAFSPNGDGTNDEFYIPNSGLTEYKIEIYDRWGVLIFASEAPAIHWDGHSTSGGMCTDGTYYFVLHALTSTNDYSVTGFITLIGSGKK